LSQGGGLKKFINCDFQRTGDTFRFDYPQNIFLNCKGTITTFNSGYGQVESSYLNVQRYNQVAGDNRTFGLYYESRRNTSEQRTGDSCLELRPSSATNYSRIPVKMSKITSTGGDMTLSIYIKKSADFNGDLQLGVDLLGSNIVAFSSITPTVSYATYSVTVPSAYLILDEVIELWARFTGTTGQIFVDA